MTIDDLKLDDEFKRLCPALKPDELRQLRDNIIRDGRFLDSIKHWLGRVVDGHNRYDVWFHGELPDGIAAPRLEELEFGTRDEALNWIILHQLGRRNLPPNEAAYLRGKLVQQKSAAPKNRANYSGKSGDPNLSQNAINSRGRPVGERRQAARQVAQATGVSTDTAQRDDAFAAAIDAIAAVNAKAAADIKSGALRVAKKDVIAIAGSGNIGAALGNLRNGLAWDHAIVPEDPEPDESIEDVMESRNAEIESFCRRLVKFFEEHCPDDEWLADLGRKEAAAAKVKEACRTLRTAKCTALCPICQGDGCGKCHDTGRVPKLAYDQLV